MDRGQRIRVIQRVRDSLGEMPKEDEDLVLETFGVGARPEDDWGNGPTLTSWLSEQADDNELEALAQHLEVLDNRSSLVAVTTAIDSAPEVLHLFGSHLSAHRALLGEVETELKKYGVRLFVAHDSIPMDAPWEREIVDALNQCHGGVVFVHPGIHASFYCMQEVGWMLGRGIPVARLMFGESPKGLLGALQGRPVHGLSASEIAAAIMDWAVVHETLRQNLAESLTKALDASHAFSVTDMVWERLRQVDTLSATQLRRVLHAVETNSQVFGANVGGWRGVAYRHAIADRAEQWDDSGSLKDRIGVLRATPSDDYIVSIDDLST